MSNPSTPTTTSSYSFSTTPAASDTAPSTSVTETTASAQAFTRTVTGTDGRKRAGAELPDQPEAKKIITIENLREALASVNGNTGKSLEQGGAQNINFASIKVPHPLPAQTDYSNKLDQCQSYQAAPAFKLYADKQGDAGVVNKLLQRGPLHLEHQSSTMSVVLDGARDQLNVSGGNIDNASEYLNSLGQISTRDRTRLTKGSSEVVACSGSMRTQAISDRATELMEQKVNEFVSSGQGRDGKELMVAVQLVGESRKGQLEQRTAVLYPLQDDVYISFSALDNVARDKIKNKLAVFGNTLNSMGSLLGLSANSSVQQVISNPLYSFLGAEGQIIKSAIEQVFTAEERNRVTINMLAQALEQKADYPLFKVPRSQQAEVLKEVFDVACTQFKNGHQGIKRLVVTPVVQEAASEPASTNSTGQIGANPAAGASGEASGSGMTREQLRAARLRALERRGQ